MSKKNTIRLTESDLKRVISESVKKVLKEDTERVINVEYDENTSFSKGRKYYYCHDNGRYYTNIDGEWYICTDNYYLEPDVHVDPSVKIITESVKKVLKETKVSLADYDNPRIRYNRMDSDAPWEQDSGYNDGPTNDYYIDEGEARWNQLLKLRNDGILTDEELDAIRDRFGY